jgi:hypothetical protein
MYLMKSSIIEVFLSKTYWMWRGQHEPGFLSCAVGGDGVSAGAALDVEAQGRRAREVARIALGVVGELEDRMFLAIESGSAVPTRWLRDLNNVGICHTRGR